MTNSTEPVKPDYIAHIALRTKRYTEMIEWYTRVFDCKALFESPILTFMTYDDEHHRFVIANIPDDAPEAPNAVGVAHYAFSFSSTHKLLSMYRRLKADGIEPRWCINHGLTLSIYYADPDGNEMEFQRDNFDNYEQSKAFFTSESYLNNPIGVPFNPDVLLEHLNQGVDREIAIEVAQDAADPTAIPTP